MQPAPSSCVADPWSLAGEYFEACNCDVACPCIFGSDPTRGDCTVLLGYHIKKGMAGTVPLDGLNFAIAVYTPGPMGKTKWEVAVYLDESASSGQREALRAIDTGKAGGPLGFLPGVVGKMHVVRFAPIDFRIEGKRRTLQVHGIGRMQSEELPPTLGSQVKIAGAHPFAPEIGVAKAEKLWLADHDWKWDTQGGNSYYAAINWKGP